MKGAQSIGSALADKPKGEAWQAIMRMGPPRYPDDGGKWPIGYRRQFWNAAWAAYTEARNG